MMTNPSNVQNEKLPWRDKDKFVKLYKEKRMMMNEMAEKWNCTKSTVSYWAEKHNIDKKLEYKKKPPDEWFVKKYREGYSGYEIAEEVNVSARRVYSILEENEVEVSRKGEVEAEDLVEMYNDGCSYRDIREKYNISYKRIRDILIENDCEVREHTHHFVPGKEHPAWNGGKKNYGFKWKDIRDDIIERENNKCFLCSIPEDWNKCISKRGLEVHHIEPYKNFDSDEEAHQMNNLIALCSFCHRRIENI